MEDFEKQLMNAVQSVVLKKIGSGDWIGVPYSTRYGGVDRLEISRDFLLSLYKRVDMDRVASLVLDKIEERMADKIFNQIVTEIGNDAKHLMCDKEARAAFREAVRGKLAAKERATEDAQ